MEQENLQSQVAKKKLKKFEHIYSWEAPERHWTYKDKIWYLKMSLLFVGLIFFSALTGQYCLILALIALLLLLFTQATIPPRMTKHEITNHALKTFDTMYKWQDIDYFWITEKDESGLFHWSGNGLKYRQVNFEMPTKNPQRLSLLIGEGDEDTIVFTLLDYIPYAEREEASDDFLSNIIYGKYIPFESYAPDAEEHYPEDEEYPEQTIVHKTDEKEPEKSKEEKQKEQEKLKEKEDKRKKQLESLRENTDEEKDTKASKPTTSEDTK